MKLNRLEILIIVLIAVIGLGTFVVSSALAEQQGGSPNSQVDSVLKETYNTLVGLNHGSEVGGNGSMWNRIISSSTWVPNGDVVASDVKNGKTFYDDNRTVKTGTLKTIDFQKQSLVVYDDRILTDYGESTVWTKTNTSPEVWKDEVTGLYWSATQGASTDNNFTVSTCNFFTTPNRGDYDGSDSDCGNSINRCGTLSLDANGDGTNDTKWYLPSQKELLQAYVDSIYKKAGTTWTSSNTFWSSTENQVTNTYAWYTYLNSGYTNLNTKSTSYSVRCILRDL